MNTSETIDKIAAAFVKAQMACETAKKANENGAFKQNGKASKYAGLPEVVEACLPACHANKIGVLQVLGETVDGKMGITTRLLHESGQWIEGHGSIPLPKQDPQGYGSASTYARRYHLAALMGIIQEDDDGNAAVKPANDTPKPQGKVARQKLDGPHTSYTALESALRALTHEMHGCGDSAMFEALLADENNRATLQQARRDLPQWLDGGPDMHADFVPINALIKRMRSDFAMIENSALRAG